MDTLLNLLKSKIFWVQLLGIVIAIIGSLATSYPEYAVGLGAVINVLTIVLRALQGKELKVAGKTIKL